MSEEEYAIVSKKEFLALKKELERIKKNPLEGSESGEDLQSSIDNLNKSLNIMLEVFKQAAEDMKLEEHDTGMVSKQIGPINEKIETLIDQNQKIAKGIVAIADMVKEKLEEIEQAESKPRLPPLTGGPGPKPAPKPAAPSPSPAPMPPPGSPARPGPMPPPGAPPGPGTMPPPGAPQGTDAGMPPLGGPGEPLPPPGAPPGAGSPPPGPGMPPPKKDDIMGGLMKK